MAEYNVQMLGFYALDIDAKKEICRFVVELFLKELGEQLYAPDEWQKVAANRAIEAFQRGEFQLVLTYIGLGETSPDQRSPLWTFSEEERRLSLRDLWRRLVYPCSAPYTSVFQISVTNVGP